MQRLGFLISLFLAACGSSSSTSPGTTASTAAPAGDGSGSDVVCRDEFKTGSSLPRRVCRSQFEADADRKGARDFISQPRTSPGVPPQ
jgi:hypothetical protein